jgi:hypothetical protein
MIDKGWSVFGEVIMVSILVFRKPFLKSMYVKKTKNTKLRFFILYMIAALTIILNLLWWW